MKAIGKILILLNALILPHFAVDKKCAAAAVAERDACIKPHQAKRDSAYAQMQRFKKLWDEASEKSGKAEKEAGALQQQCKAEQNTAQDKYREKYKSCIK